MPLKTESIELDNLAADPGSPADGRIWYNSTDDRARIRVDGITRDVTAPQLVQVGSSGTITTTSTTDVIATSMVFTTPPAGAYLIIFSGTAHASTGSNTATMSIYVGGVRQDESERIVMGSGDTPFACVVGTLADGAQDIDARWKVNSGTGTMKARTLIIVEAVP